MIAQFHFLRPWSFLILIPLVVSFWRLNRMNFQLKAWSAICDQHLLSHLVHYSGKSTRSRALMLLFISIFWIIFSMAGPTWSKFPVPSYAPIMPRVVLLDLSDAMSENDLSPNRLTRAKFKLHDLFSQENSSAKIGQIGFIVFTSEPFVVSPLTDDAKTIDSLLESVSPAIMPVNGYRLDLALEDAAKVLEQAGFRQGQLLVLTAETPNAAAMTVAQHLADQGIITSVMPVRAKKNANDSLFKALASSGGGLELTFSDNSSDLQAWLRQKNGDQAFQFSQKDNIPIWRDEGRWFLIPAFIFMLPVFRRGWLQRVAS